MLQLGEEAWVGLPALALLLKGGSSIMKVDGSQLRVATRSGLGKGEGGQDGPAAGSWQPSPEGVKASQHVRLLMIAVHRDLLGIKGKPFPAPECERG